MKGFDVPARRSYPRDPLSSTLVVAQTIADQNAGRPMKRLLVADALDVKPSSSNFRYLLSSSHHYGLSEGTEKADEISLTTLGAAATKPDGSAERAAVLIQAARTPPLFNQFFERFNGNKMPTRDMLQKLVVADFGVPKERAEEAADLIVKNGEFIGAIRNIGGSPHVMLDSASSAVASAETATDDDHYEDENVVEYASPIETPPPAPATERQTKPIFLGHGKNKRPVEAVKSILDQFKIPYRMAVGEANLGRPIPTKVKQTMEECGSAILIFTKDEELFDSKGDPIWRPSENVVHELGAASFAYEDRVVIFKERGINLPTNFSSGPWWN